MYAQPLVVDHPGGASTPPGTSVIVATENDTVYSLNGATGAVQWETSVGTAWNSSVNACADLAPKIGITATPVYDPSTLDRMEHGTFGLCAECGDPISKPRLQAIPYARHCIRCARKLEGGESGSERAWTQTGCSCSRVSR